MPTCKCRGKEPCEHEYISRFEKCLDRYRQSKGEYGKSAGILGGGDNGVVRTSPTIWSRPGIEYIADFESVGRRALKDEVHKIIFKYLFVENRGPWKTLGELVKAAHRTDPVIFISTTREIKIKLGKVFSELQPYALWPVQAYMHQSRLSDCSSSAVMVKEAKNSGVQLTEQLAKSARGKEKK